MFKTKNLIVFFVATLMLTAGCQSTNSKKNAKTIVVKKDTKAKKEVKGKKPAVTQKIEKSVPKKDAKAKKVSKSAKVKKEEVDPNRKCGGCHILSNYSIEETICKHRKNFPIEIGFVTPLQFPCDNTMINGFRLSILYTYNKGVNGLDCGFICDAGSGGSKGIQVGAFNRTSGSVDGLTLGLINIAGMKLNGVQISAFVNQAGSDSYDNAGANYHNSYGFQLSTVNIADSIFKGVQIGLGNISNTVFKGCQIGFVNLYDPPSDVFDDFESKEFIAMKKKRSCVQIGVLNFNPNGVFPVTLLVNW